jgi:hypothetical protein
MLQHHLGEHDPVVLADVAAVTKNDTTRTTSPRTVLRVPGCMVTSPVWQEWRVALV